MSPSPTLEMLSGWSWPTFRRKGWQAKIFYRACKTDLALESPRLWSWKYRLKLLLMVSLVYSFLLSLLNGESASLVQGLLRSWCHRTGIRANLSSLWLAHSPTFSICQENQG